MIDDIQNPLQIARGISEIWHPLKWMLLASFLLDAPALVKTKRPNFGWVLIWLATLLYTTHYTVVGVTFPSFETGTGLFLALRLVTALAAIPVVIGSSLSVRECRTVYAAGGKRLAALRATALAVSLAAFMSEVYHVEYVIYWLQKPPFNM